jgi:hypothetical protein
MRPVNRAIEQRKFVSTGKEKQNRVSGSGAAAIPHWRDLKHHS